MEGLNIESASNHVQHIWGMLDDMAQNDPTAYRKFIDKQIKEGKQSMAAPEPHMCVKTQVMGHSTQRYIYINVFAWNRIPSAKSDEDPIPIMGGPLYREGKGGEGDQLVSVAFNPKVLEDYGIDSNLSEERRMLIFLALDYIQDQHKITLSRSYIVMPQEDRTRGSLDLARKNLCVKTKGEEEKFEKDLEELEKSFGPMAAGCKDSLLNQMSNISLESERENTHFGNNESPNTFSSNISLNTEPVKKPKKGLIEDINGCCSLPEPPCETSKKHDRQGREVLIMKIHLDGVRSVHECELDISQTDVHLLVPETCELHTSLEKPVLEGETTAKFSKKSHMLTLAMPVVPS